MAVLGGKALEGRGVAEQARGFLRRVDGVDRRLRWARLQGVRRELAADTAAARGSLERSALGHALGGESTAVHRALGALLEDPEACVTAALEAARRAVPDSLFVGRRLRDVPAGRRVGRSRPGGCSSSWSGPSPAAPRWRSS